jgi:hypothetical protein
MKRATYLSILVILLLAVLPVTAFAGYTISPRLLAGQTEFAGVVKITGDHDWLVVEFMLRAGAGWCMTESAVHVGLSLDDFPQNSGGAIPGQFDYKAVHDPCTSKYTYRIPVQGDWYRNQIYIATHAVVIGPDGEEETAWAVNCGDLEGGQFPGSNWSAYITFPANAWED